MSAADLLSLRDAVTRGDAPAARRIGEALLRHQRDRLDVLLLLAQLAGEQGRSGEAQNLLERARRAHPQAAGPHFNLGILLQSAGKLDAAIAAYRRALDRAPDLLEAQVNLTGALRLLGRLEEAREVLTAAVAQAPDAPPVRAAAAALAAALGVKAEDLLPDPELWRLIPQWHFGMMNDRPRNNAFEQALRCAIRPGMEVLEIGTGSGLLAMMAARAGAGHVYTVEMVPQIAAAAREIIARNGFADRITVLGAISTDLVVGRDLPRRCDLLVAEVLSSDVVGEGVIAAFAHARAALLAPDAPILPRGAQVLGALAGDTGIGQWFTVGEVSGFDLSPFNRFSITKVLIPGMFPLVGQVDLLCPPQAIFSFDLTGDLAAQVDEERLISVTAAGRCVGILQWLAIDLDGVARYENHPLHHQGPCGWSSFLHRFSAPVDLRPGQTLRLRVRYGSRATRWDLLEVIDGS